MADADEAIRRLLLRLASDPASTCEDEHATGSRLAWGLTLDGVREAVYQYISDGDRVKVTMVKKHPKALAGQPAYEVKPEIDGRRFYVRMAIIQPDPNAEALLVLSFHPD